MKKNINTFRTIHYILKVDTTSRNFTNLSYQMAEEPALDSNLHLLRDWAKTWSKQIANLVERNVEPVYVKCGGEMNMTRLMDDV